MRPVSSVDPGSCAVAPRAEDHHDDPVLTEAQGWAPCLRAPITSWLHWQTAKFSGLSFKFQPPNSHPTLDLAASECAVSTQEETFVLLHDAQP